MFHLIEVLSDQQIARLREISAKAKYVDGKISNPHSKVKNNLQINDAENYNASAKLLFDALMHCEEFRDTTFPTKVAPPMMTRYTPGMNYGLHADSAIIPLQHGPLRSDISCTIFLSDPDSYEGGALRIQMGSAEQRFKGKPGTAILYPSNTLHEVEPVTEGERHVAITFIESRIADTNKRNLLYELNEVAALEGNNMSYDNYTRLQSVQYNLSRMWMTN